MTRALLGFALAVAGQALAWPLPLGGVTGNRVAGGAGTFPRWQALVLTTEVPITWLAALPPRRLAAVDRDGALLIFEIAPSGLRVSARYGGVASPDSGLAVARLDQEQIGVVLVAPDGRLLVWSGGVLRGYDVGGPLSPLSVPVPVAFDGRSGNDLLAVAQDGAVVLISGLAAGGPRAVSRLDVRALRDARIALADLDGDGTSEAVVLSDATARDAPGASTDHPGAASVTVIRIRPYGLDLRAHFALPSSAMFQDCGAVLAPIVGSGAPAVLLARAAPGQGAAPIALRLRERSLVLMAEGAGRTANRSLHLIGAADLSGAGAPEVVAVATAGDDAVLTVYRRAAGALIATASAAGYAAHATDARRQDQAMIADLDGDGRPEVVLPRQSREVLVGLELRGDRLVERWAVDFKSPLTSNLIAADLDGDGLLDIAIGVHRGLHVFLSAH